MNHHLSILGRQPAINDGEPGMDRAKDLTIYCWGHLGHYAVDGPPLNHKAETVDIARQHSTQLQHLHVHRDFALLIHMQTANSRRSCECTVMLNQACLLRHSHENVNGERGHATKHEIVRCLKDCTTIGSIAVSYTHLTLPTILRV